MWKKPSSGPVDLEIEYSLRSARDKPCTVQLTQPSVQGAMSSSLGEPGVAAGYFLEIHSGPVVF